MTTSTEPTAYVLWHRAPQKGARWRKVGTAGTHAGAVRLMSGTGDWHIAPLYDERLARPAGPAAVGPEVSAQTSTFFNKP
jgi:hypothetical protein